MQTLIEKLKAAIMSESYEDRAGRSVISVKSALDIVDRLAAERRLYSAEEIIKCLDGVKGACSHGVCEEVLENINRLAAEQPKKDSGWILCSERLPEIAGYEVLATLENAIGKRRVTVIFTGYGVNPPWHCNHKEFDLSVWKVIAWRPLPEACKTGQVLAAEQEER